MDKVIFGKTGLEVTRSAFGGLPIQRLSMAEGAVLVRSAFDSGINFFDTARAYYDSEEMIGNALKEVRAQVVIATKTMATTPEGFWADLETSLTKLQTDYIDIYQFHNPAKVPEEASALYQCALKAKTEGKIRHIGISCHPLMNAKKALKSGLYETMQYPLSALSTEEEFAFAKQCGEANMGVIAMKALCGGLLTSPEPSMARLRDMPYVVPVWGLQHQDELDAVLAAEENPPALDAAMLARIEKDRAELMGNFCRGCGYCMPCAVNIRLNWCARMPQALRRMSPETFYTEEWQEEMAKIHNCTECGMCVTRCPYKLNIPQRIKENFADWEQFGKAHGFLKDMSQ